MKLAPRRKRSDSAAAAIAAAQAAALGPLEPPAHVALRPGDRPYWDDIMQARARDSWTGPDLVAAANLARCLADVERLQGEVNTEGDIIADKLKDRKSASARPTTQRGADSCTVELKVESASTQQAPPTASAGMVSHRVGLSPTTRAAAA